MFENFDKQTNYICYFFKALNFTFGFSGLIIFIGQLMRNTRGLMVKMLDCGRQISELELQSLSD